MDLLYFATPEGNFGDDLNVWLWDALLPGWRDWRAPGHLVGVGTILKRGFLPAGPKLVLGSGVGYGTAPDLAADGPWDIRAVRGPRTAAALGLAPETAFVDPAVMIPTLPEFADLPRAPSGGGEVVFVPHYRSAALYDWPAICAGAGVAYQTPATDSRVVIRRLAAARAVIAESMHAAIIADAFGVPWRGVSVSASFNRFKWHDWSESLGLAEPPIDDFFVPLRRGQRALRDLRRRRPAGTTAGATAGGPGPAVSGPAVSGPAETPRSLATSPLAPLLKRWAKRDLAAAAARPFALTDRDRLKAAQDRLAAMLAEVAADYAATDGRRAAPPLQTQL